MNYTDKMQNAVGLSTKKERKEKKDKEAPAPKEQKSKILTRRRHHNLEKVTAGQADQEFFEADSFSHGLAAGPANTSSAAMRMSSWLSKRR